MYIVGMGSHRASTVITNKFLEDLDIGTNAEWIEEKIGIIERLSSLPLDYIRETRNQDPRMTREVQLMTSCDLGVGAAKEALKSAGINASDVGLLLSNCCSPTSFIPSEGQRMAAELGITCRAHEVTSACPIFALHMDYLNNFDPDKLPDYILCISAGALTHHVNYNDRSDGAIWGDGAAAWVVSPRHKGRLKIQKTFFHADPTRCAAVVVDTKKHFHQDGRAVRDFSVRQTVRLIKALEESEDLNWEKDIFIGHQANRTMLEQIATNRHIPPHNHWHNVEYIGNQAGAGAPAVLSQNWDRLNIPGQKVVVAVVGAGLSWGTVLMEVQ